MKKEIYQWIRDTFKINFPAYRYKFGNRIIIDNGFAGKASPLFPGDWKCHICRRWRPDRKISVLSFGIKDFPGAIRNVRYCSDNALCVDAADAWRTSQRV